MASLEKIAQLVAVAVLMTCFFVLAENKPNIAILENMCNNTSVDETPKVVGEINDMFEQLLDKTANNGYNFEWDGLVGDHHCWGNAACNGALTNHDCSECLLIAKDYLVQLCPFMSGAHIKLVDCRLRYEPYEFHDQW